MRRDWTRRGVLAGAGGLLAAPVWAQTPRPVRRAELGAAARYSAERGGLSFLVMRNGVVLGEDYPNGGGVERLNELRAGTQAFAAALAGRMAEHGILSLDEPVAATIIDWAFDPRKARITVRQLLGMSAGLALETPPGLAPLTAEAIAAPAAYEPDERFIYQPAAYQVFVEFARRKLANAGAPQEVDQYLRQYVLDPIGAPLVMFKRGGDGNLWLGAGASATARSWAAFGELIRRGGVWRAQHVLEPAVYREMVMGRAVSGMRYGLGFWLGMATATNDPVPDGAPDIWQLGAGVPVDTIMAAGAGAQRLYAIPSRRLVIVRQGNPNPPDGAAPWSDSAFLRLVLAQV